MKKFLTLMLAAIIALFAVAALAEENPFATVEEFAAAVEEELKVARDVVYYPHAFEGDFEQLYVNFHKLSRARYETVAPATEKGIVMGHYDLYKNLKEIRESMVQIAEPASTVWDIWVFLVTLNFLVCIRV